MAVVPPNMLDIVQLICAAAVLVGAYDRYVMVPPELVTVQLPTQFAVGQAAVAEQVTIVEPPGLTQELIATAFNLRTDGFLLTANESQARSHHHSVSCENFR